MTAAMSGSSAIRPISWPASISASTSRARWERRRPAAALSAPIFRDFMIEALKDKPATPFRVPPGVRLVKVNEKTGERWVAGDEGLAIWEAFKPGTEPTGQQQIIEGYANYGQDAGYGSVIPTGPFGAGAQGVYNDSGTTIIDSTGVYQGGQQQPAGQGQPTYGQQPAYEPATAGLWPAAGLSAAAISSSNSSRSPFRHGQPVPVQQVPSSIQGQQPVQPQYPVQQQQAPVLVPPPAGSGGRFRPLLKSVHQSGAG